MALAIRRPRELSTRDSPTSPAHENAGVTPEAMSHDLRVAALARGEITALADIQTSWKEEKTLLSGTLTGIGRASSDKIDYRSEKAALKQHAYRIDELFQKAIKLKRKDPVYCGIKSSTLWRNVVGYGGYLVGIGGIGSMGYSFSQGEKQEAWSIGLTVAGYVLTAGRDWLYNRAVKEIQDQQTIHDLINEFMSAKTIIIAQQANLRSIEKLIALSQRPGMDEDRVRREIGQLKGKISQAADRTVAPSLTETPMPVSVRRAEGALHAPRMSAAMPPSLAASELAPSFDEAQYRRPDPFPVIYERSSVAVESQGLQAGRKGLVRRWSYSGGLSQLSTIAELSHSRVSGTDTSQARGTTDESRQSTARAPVPADHVAVLVGPQLRGSTSSSVVSLEDHS